MPRQARQASETGIYHVMMRGILPHMYTIIITSIQETAICSASVLKVSL